MRRPNLSVPVLLLALLLPAAARADCDIDALTQLNTSYDSLLLDLSTNDCLGGAKADAANSLVAQVNGLLPAVNVDDKALSRMDKVRAALSLLSAQAQQRAQAGVQPGAWLALAHELAASERKFAAIGAGTDEAQAQRLAEAALDSRWDKVQGRRGALSLDGQTVELLAPTGCATYIPAPCDAFDSQRDMVRQFHLVRRIRAFSQFDSLAKHYADAELQTQRWETYRSGGQHQYFWEVYLNGRLMEAKNCAHDPTTQIQRGFCSVPTSQWILLHPDAALRYSRSANSSSELKPALVVEMLGYYHWNWAGNQSSEMSDRLGGSFIAAYSDTGQRKQWSYGPMLHVGAGYNIAATRAPGGQWSLVLNLNLAERYFGRKQAFADYLKNGKQDLGALINAP